MNSHFLVITFHEIAIKYESELKTQFVLLDISSNHNVRLPRYLRLKFCQMIYLFKMFIMLWRIFNYAAGYLGITFQRISAKLAIPFKHNIIFAKFSEIQLDVTSSLTHIRWTKQNSFGSQLSLSFPIFINPFRTEAIII